MARKQAIRQAFGSATRYDQEAHVQREVAIRLAERIAGLPLPPNPRILEIGCGTGFLTSALRERGVSGDWTVTDLSPLMVARCRDASGGVSGVHYLAMDGEQPCFAEHVRFDLICSSLAFQWFDDLHASVARLARWLAPGGYLAFTTMADGSFAEWRVACLACDQRAASPDYPSVTALAAVAPPGFEVDVADFSLQPRFDNARAFLQHLRRIGAHVPRDQSRPLPPGAMRQVMRAFESGGAVATYHIASCTFRKAA